MEAAIIGAGLMGRWHASSVRRNKGRIVAVVDPNFDRAKLLGRRFSATVFPSIDAMLERQTPRAAHICTPAHAHAHQIERLLAAGCHVLCEKPLAASAGEVARLLNAAGAANRVLCPVHQFAMQRGVREVAGRIEELGEIKRVVFTFCSAGGEHLPPAELDTVVLDIAPHAFSVLAQLFPARDLTSVDWHALHPVAGEVVATGALGQTVITLAFSMASRPTEASATIAGTRGSADIDFFHGFAFFSKGAVSRLHKATRPLTFSATQFAKAASNLAGRAARGEFAYPGLDGLVAAFHQSIVSGGPPPFSTAETLGIYRSRDALARQFLPAK